MLFDKSLLSSVSRFFIVFAIGLLAACDGSPLNSPYPKSQDQQSILYTSFSERPKHLDPAKAYSSNEYALIGQIYEPPLQYHYLRRPYTLVPLTARTMPEVVYLDEQGKILMGDADTSKIRYTDYIIEINAGIRYQPHPALAKDAAGHYLYHELSAAQIESLATLADFKEQGSRELVAEDYVYQIKRLAHPSIHSPIAELMKRYIVGLDDFSRNAAEKDFSTLRDVDIEGVRTLGRYRYRIRIEGKYPQFIYWLAMPFFAPMPWEADVFYAQPGLRANNITLDWFPIGTGPYLLQENNPNLRMILQRNPNFHAEYYPSEGESGDLEKGLLLDAGKTMPFIDKVIYILEKETIPYWNKFLQGYYDASGIASDSFDQAIQFSASGQVELTPALHDKGIQLQTAVTSSIFYMGFNMLDAVVGGYSESARKLRQAISIAVDYEEYIAIFMNGRGVAAQGLLPPGIYGYDEGVQGMNRYVYNWSKGRAQRKSIDEARRLMQEAGFPDGRNPKTGEALILYLDTAASGPDDRARLNWYRKQLARIGIQLVIRATDYNRFQQKMRTGHAQLFLWGWNADYPDPENFFFLLYGPNAKVPYGGENAVNYQNKQFDRLFEKMRNMDNGPERYRLIHRLQEIVRYDAPWVFGFHPMSFSLFHSWYQNLKPNLMANNRLKYSKIDVQKRNLLRKQWNKPVFWPLFVLLFLMLFILWPAFLGYRRRMRRTGA